MLQSRRDPIIALLVVVALLALYPVVRTVVDWVQVYRVIATPRVDATVRSYDWIEWEDDEGIIDARYVFPRGPAFAAGVRPGDVFYLLDYQQYFTGSDVRSAIEGVPPGTTVQYSVVRGDDNLDMGVEITRYPTFLYPLSATLWRFSLWGFAFAAFIHVLGLVIAVPLAARSVEARYSLVLIGVSALWIFGNLARILSIEFLGPPTAGSTYDNVFHLVAVASLVGWIAFPVLLVREVLSNAFPDLLRRVWHSILYLPTIVLTLVAATAIVRDSVGPFTLDHLVAPILFYASCYIALASLLILLAPESEYWSRRGSQVTLVVSVLAALAILGVVPVLTDSGQERAGWFVVFTQLLSTAPVILVSIATLRFGRMDAVIRRALSYTLIGGGLFFLLVVLLGLVDARMPGSSATRNVVAALLAALTVLVVERLVRLAAPYVTSVFPSERKRATLLLERFQDNVRDIVELPNLVHESVDVVGEAFEARSAVLFVQSPVSPGQWISANYHPEPPYVTEAFLQQVWPHFVRDPAVWAYNPALNRSNFSADVSASLTERGTALAQPIVGRDGPVGLVVLGRKKERGAVYNLGDIDRMQWLSGQLALAIERVKLIERHNLLARETAQAQLVALRSQINPHFLFNALNTIMALIREKPDEAERTLDHLASIFRTILHSGDKELVALEDELELVRAYLAIEQVRFGDKLTIRERVSDESRSFPVPAFAIQTLVENAVKHGIERKIDGGTIEIDITRPEVGLLAIRVSDTGVGIPALFGADDTVADDRAYFGIGLNNVVLRVEQMYGRSDLFRVTSDPRGGTVVELLIPANGS